MKDVQECIPVRCVPFAAVAVSGGGEGLCLERECLPMGNFCPGMCVSGPGVYTSPTVNRMTDACENIAFPHLLLPTVSSYY